MERINIYNEEEFDYDIKQISLIGKEDHDTRN